MSSKFFKTLYPSIILFVSSESSFILLNASVKITPSKDLVLIKLVNACKTVVEFNKHIFLKNCMKLYLYVLNYCNGVICNYYINNTM